MRTPRVAALLALAFVCLLTTNRTASAQTDYYPLTPCRVLDTRNPAGPYGGPRMGAGQTRTFTITGTCGVPAEATAISINLAVIVPAAAGFAQIYPGNGAPPITSILNFRAGRTRANDALVALASDASGTIKLINNSTGPADYALDVAGYFAPPPCTAITVTNPGVNAGLAGAAFSQTFTQTGAQNGATFSVATGSLPSGWTLSAAGVLANANPSPVQFTITVKVTDGFGCIGTGGSYTVTITPGAGDDVYGPSIVGNMSIDTSTGTAFSVLTNDTAGSTANLLGGGATAQGGQVVLNPATGTFTYNPPRGFTGADSFQYTVSNNGQTSAPATVSLTVAGMAWFIDNNPGACSSSCDGRRTNPYPTSIAFETVNNGSPSNPKSGDSVFFYESATVYDGTFVPLSGQRIVGQDATSTFAAAMNLTVPDTTVAVPVMNPANGATSTISAPSSSMTFVLQPDCALIGMTIVASSGNAVWGTSFLGTITISDVQMQASGPADAFRLQGVPSGNVGITGGSITQSGSGFAVVLSGISANVNVGSTVTATSGQPVYVSQFGGTVNFNNTVSASGAALGIQVIHNADSTVTFNSPVNLGNFGSRLSGGPAVSVDSGSHASAFTTFSFLSAITNGQQALLASNGGHLTVSGGNIDTQSGQVLSLSSVDVNLTFGVLNSVGSGSGQGVLLSSVSGVVHVTTTNLSGHPNQGILVTGSTADASFGDTTINGGTDAVSLQNNTSGTRTFGSLTIGNSMSPSGIGFLHAVGGGNVLVTGPTVITNPFGSSAIDIQGVGSTMSIFFGGSTTVTKSAGTGVSVGNPAANNLASIISFTGLNVMTSNGTALRLGTTPFSSGGGVLTATGGPAIDANGTLFSSSGFASVSSSGSSSYGVNLVNTTGALTMFAGSIPNASNTAFNVSGGSVNVQYNGNVTQNGAQYAVSVASSAGGTKTFNGAISSSGLGKGISLVSNPGTAIAFTGPLTLSTGTNVAFSASLGGSVTATAPGSVITTSTASGVSIIGVDIGAAGFTVQSVSSFGSSSAGIILDTTGPAGGFTVTGFGSPGTGGQIASKSWFDGLGSDGTGIYLNSTTNPSFAFMQLNDFSNFAILGNNVAGLTLYEMVVDGTNGTITTGSGEGDVYLTNLTGSASVTFSTFSGAAFDTFHVVNSAGVLNRLTIANCTFGSMGVSGNDGLFLQATGGTFNATVQTNQFTSAKNYMFQLDVSGTASSDVVLGGGTGGLANTLVNSHSSITAGRGGVLVGGSGSNETLTYNIGHNFIRGASGAALTVSKGAGAGGSFSGTIDSNTIGTPGVLGSGSTSGDGIAVLHIQNGTSTATITNNQVYGSSGTGAPIHTLITDNTSGSGKLVATIQANTIATVGPSASAGILSQFGAVAADAHRACYAVGGGLGFANTVNLSGTTTTNGITVNQVGATLVYAGGPTTAAAVKVLVTNSNAVAGVGGGGQAVVVTAATGYQASCPP